MGLQIHLDFRDETLRVNLLRLADGKLPEHSFISRGERVRISFLLLLRDVLRVEDGAVEALFDLLYYSASPRDYQFGEDLLVRWRDLVERYIDRVVREPLTVLFPPPPPDASPASQA